MIEAKDDIELATMRLLETRQSSRKDYQKIVSEGRLAVWQERTKNANSALATDAPPPASDSESTAVQESVGTNAPLPAPDPQAEWRYVRLAITAGLVVLLFVVWIWQRKRGR